jgi:hypothetical protein
VEFDEFKAIHVAGFLAEAKNPYFNWKNRFDPYDDKDVDPLSNDQLTPEIFVTSEVKIVFVDYVYSSLSKR